MKIKKKIKELKKQKRIINHLLKFLKAFDKIGK